MELLNPPTLSLLPEIERLADNADVPAVYFDHCELPDQINSVSELRSLFQGVPLANYVDSYEPSIIEDNIYILREVNENEEEPLFFIVPRTIFVEWWKTV